MRFRDSGVQLIVLVGLLDHRPKLLSQLSLRDLGMTWVTCALDEKRWLESAGPGHQYRLNILVAGYMLLHGDGIAHEAGFEYDGVICSATVCPKTLL